MDEFDNSITILSGIFILGNLLIISYLFLRIKQLEKQVFLPKSQKLQLEGTEKNRLEKSLPCPIGWYAVCDSDELPVGKIIPFHCCGIDLAIWRGQSGKSFSIDAYCPHLGANIAYGKVKGDEATCPFHLWCFDKTGKCTSIWYNDKPIPSRATVKGYPTVDWAGRVWFYYHPEKKDVPDYDFPSMEEFNGCYTVNGVKRDIRSHAWEILENCSDPIHFQVLHKHPWFIIPGFGKLFFEVIHEFLECGEENWILNFKEAPIIKFLGFKIPNIVSVHTRFIGITCHVFEFNIKGLGKATMIKSLTQISPTVCIERDIWYVDKKIPRFFVWYLQGQSAVAFNEDFVAWENKIFLKKPLVVTGDGLINRRRGWSKRFFPQQQQSEDKKDLKW